jgi:hypothetical protein
MAEEVPGTAALNTGGNAAVQTVSCPSAGNCSAGGYYNAAGGVFVVTEVSGTWGTAEQIPGSAALNQGGEAVVNVLSCASAGNCAVAGGYTDSSGFGHGFVASQVHGTWGMAEEVLGTDPLRQLEPFISSVSCASAGNCSAGGSYTDITSHVQAFVVKEVNGSWGKAREVPGTAALNTGGGAVVRTVSCASAGNCSAGGYYTDSTGNQQAFVVTQTSGTWGNAREVPGTAGLNTGGNARVQAVSCASAGSCSAGGSYIDRSGLGQAFVVVQTGGTWGKAREVPGTGALNQDGGAAVTSVSCASAGNCSAGGQYNDSPPGRGQAFVVSQVNGTWAKAKQVPGTAALDQGDYEANFSGPSCSSAGNCSAGGSYTDSSGHGQAFVVNEVNGTWDTAEEVPGTAALNPGGFAQALSVSCAQAGTCSAGGLYTDSSGQLQAFVVNKA